MHYVISDIHGCYDEYRLLLEKIEFCEADKLYVLGDAVDRGPAPIRVVQDLMKRQNVTYMLGNHDYLFDFFVRKLGLEMRFKRSTKYLKIDYTLWLEDGGSITNDQFLRLPLKERRDIAAFLKQAPLYKEVEIDRVHYVLVHAGIENYKPEKKLHAYTAGEFLEGRTDYSQPLFSDNHKILVTGHTPTPYFRADHKAEIFIGNGHIAVDCGAVYGGRLAAYCFETKECFYV